MLTNIAKGCYY